MDLYPYLRSEKPSQLTSIEPFLQDPSLPAYQEVDSYLLSLETHILPSSIVESICFFFFFWWQQSPVIVIHSGRVIVNFWLFREVWETTLDEM